MLYNVLDILIRGICYTGAFLSLWFLLSPLIIPNIKKNINFLNLKSNLKKSKKTNKSLLYKHIEMLLTVTRNRKSKFDVMTFYVGSFALLAITFLLLQRTYTTLTTKFMVAAGFSLIPYIILRVRLYSMRIDASYEAEPLLIELKNQYKLNHQNMIEAIDQAYKGLKNKCKHTKKALFRLSMAAKQYKTPEELDEAILEFTFAIDTQWAMLLAQNIYQSIEFGDDVTESFDDNLEDVKDIKAKLENNKQINHEAFVMIKYVSITAYVLSVIAAMKYFGFTIKKFISYQVNTDLGLKFFAMTVISMVLCYIIYIAARKPKYDF